MIPKHVQRSRHTIHFLAICFVRSKNQLEHHWYVFVKPNQPFWASLKLKQTTLLCKATKISMHRRRWSSWSVRSHSERSLRSAFDENELITITTSMLNAKRVATRTAASKAQKAEVLWNPALQLMAIMPPGLFSIFWNTSAAPNAMGATKKLCYFPLIPGWLITGSLFNG